MSSTRYLDLTADELILLSDRVKHDDTVGKYKEIAPSLILKLGSAFLELCGERKSTSTVVISVTLPEAQMLREKILIKDRSDDTPKLGILFLRKIYEILLSFDSEVDLVYTEEQDKSYKVASKRDLYNDLEESSHA